MGQQPGSEIEEAQPQTAAVAGRRVRFGLTNRLLVLLLIFIMVAEVAVYIPTIANFRNAWLRDRLAAASTAALVFEAAPAGSLPDELETAILRSVGAKTIVLKTRDARRLLAASDMPSRIDESFDMRAPSHWSSIVSAFRTLTASHDRVLNVVGEAPMGADHIEITLDEAPLRRDMLVHSINVLLLSLLSSSFVALLAAIAIHLMVLRPVRRLTSSITAFGLNPEAAGRVITPSGRNDEIGVAEDALAIMQRDLLRELIRKKRLAALGLAVAKINHDLRNMLASAQLLSDRLSDMSDPIGRRIAPKLVSTLDRAISFCQATLVYGRAVEPAPKATKLTLHTLVTDVVETIAPLAQGVEIDNAVPRDFEAFADSEQLFRVLLNLVRNSVDALAGAGAVPGAEPLVRIRARKEPGITVIEVCDNGPGVPPQARASLFQAFSGSSRPGGTGLGLSIAADIVHAHGGEIILVPASADRALGGATFRITLPQRRKKPVAPSEAA
jgi:signal transduction histidine kinase